MGARPSLREDRDWSLRPQSLRASQRPHQSAHKLEREREEGDQIKRISSPESNSGEISESGINPENLELNSISSFGSRSEQISASRKPLFLDTTLCLKEPSQESMIAGQGQESCLHTPVWGVEGFNISTYKEVEEELTTGKQHTRVFNGLNNHNVEENSNDTAMINTTINFDDLLLGDTIGQSSTSTAPTMDLMIEEENQNLTIERNTVPLLEDTTNIMEMIENASFDFTLPEPFPTTTLHITEQKTEGEQMVEVINNNNNTETVWAGVSFDDANLGLCLPAFEAEGRIELPVNVANNNNNNGNVESSEADDLLKWIMDDTQIADFAFPNEVEEATTSFLIKEVKVEEEVKEEEATKATKRSRIKMEELTEEEKYRRMREQNNRASQACRAKRKRKLAEEETELAILEQKNIQLQAVLKDMEKEVASYKKRILEQVSGVRT